MQDLPAVYCIYLDGELSYIGQSSHVRFRFQQHKLTYCGLSDTKWGSFKIMHVKIKFPSKYGMEAMIEKRLIRRLKPRFNKNNFKMKLKKECSL